MGGHGSAVEGWDRGGGGHGSALDGWDRGGGGHGRAVDGWDRSVGGRDRIVGAVAASWAAGTTALAAVAMLWSAGQQGDDRDHRVGVQAGSWEGRDCSGCNRESQNHCGRGDLDGSYEGQEHKGATGSIRDG